jgi:hypothetical protein
MNYTTLIAEAWAATWRYRFLWVLGLLAGITGGTMGLGRSSVPEPPSAANLLATIQTTLGPNVLQLSLIAAAAVVLAVVVSVLARGGITQATIDLQSGVPSSFGRALSAGRRWFWRFLILLALLGALVGVVLGASALAIGGLGSAGAALAAGVLSLGAVASIVLAYAERAIVVRDLSALDGLRHGWQVFSAHRGTSLLAWIISVLAAAWFAVLGGSMWEMFASTVAIVLVCVLAAIANTFFWNFWTLTYLRLDPPTSATA